MYKISVPIMLSTVKRSGGLDAMLEQLNRMGAKRVFLAIEEIDTDLKKAKRVMADLKEACEFLKARGFEVGSWMWTFAFKGKGDFSRLRAANGHEINNSACPFDKKYRSLMRWYVQNIAKCGVDMIMFDDDYRYGFLTDGGILCTCDLHMKKICNILGEPITPAELQSRAIYGEKNKYRDAWLKVNGQALTEFATAMREALDEVSPATRMGLCSCMSLWDNDGVDTVTISRLLAGDTKPFIRLIGAPYWAVEKGWGNRLQNIFELERMERSWCEDDIEIFAEGDTWPRPRTSCPAAYLELFDMAMRADGQLDGILKYAIDYYSSYGYESGYIERHIKNAPVYEGIEKAFSGKDAVGIRIYEAMNKLADMKIPKAVENSAKIEEIFFSPAARLLSDNSIPSVYTGEGVCSVAFGENIKYVPKNALKKGIIIDKCAAEILAEMGIDTGIAKINGSVTVSTEHYIDLDEYTNICRGARVSELELKEGAMVSSTFICDGKEIPATYFYENKDGDRFFVYTFDAYFINDYLMRGYARSRQIADAVKVLSGNTLPAYTYGNPDLYLMCKKNSTSMAVGLWNVFADTAFSPCVELDDKYNDITFINCTGRLEEDKVILSDILPFAFAGFEVKK